MDKTIKECIEYAYNHEFITYGNYVDLLNDLDELIDASIQLDNLKEDDEE